MIKKFFWDMSWRQGRYEYLHWLLRNIPGHFGIAIRRKVLKRFFCHAGDGLQIYPGVHIRGIHNLALGSNVNIGLDVLINANGGIEMGDDILIGPGVKIWSVNHHFREIERPILDQGYEDKKVTISSRCWIGAGCIILPGAMLGEGVIISAGAVVSGKKIAPYIILAGNPARKIGSRLPNSNTSITEADRKILAKSSSNEGG